MWNGAFSPFQKVELVAWFDPENADDLDSKPPEEIIGIMTVILSNREYHWEVTYEEYLDFLDSGFDSAYLNDKFPINYVGDWGWRWGRTRQTGWAG